MKKLGLVGGTGPESTISYYRAINEGVQAQLGEHVLPPIVIDSLNVFQVLELCSRRDFDTLTEYLTTSVQQLADAGADVVSFTALTPHVVFDRVSAACPVPMVSAVDASRNALVADGVASVALLGTKPTMTEGFFAGPLEAAGIAVALPNAEEIEYIQHKIVTELEHGVVTDDALVGFTAIIERLRDEAGAQQVILGCTELPLLLNDENSPLPTVDPVEIHTRALIDAVVD